MIFGLIWGLREFSNKVSTNSTNLNVQVALYDLPSTFRNFTTANYKFHILEQPTGIKFVLMTKPKVDDFYSKL